MTTSSIVPPSVRVKRLSKEPSFLTPAILALAAAASAVVFALIRTRIVDDAYITLTYARNVAFHLHWGLNPTETANTATSALNVLVLAVLTVIVRNPILALGILFTASSVVITYALLRTTRAIGLPQWSAVLGGLLVLFNPLLLSSVGLETALGGAMLALLLMAVVEGQPVQFGVYSGLAILTRIDLVIFVVVLFIGSRGLWRAWWKVAAIALAINLPWLVWSWVVLGSAVPDTLIIKTSQKAIGPWPTSKGVPSPLFLKAHPSANHSWSFGNGPLFYFYSYPAATVLSFLPGVFGALGLLAWPIARIRRASQVARRFAPVALLGLGAVLYYAAYSHLHVPPYHWYYGSCLIALSIVAALGVGAIWNTSRVTHATFPRVRHRIKAVAPALLVLLTVVQAGLLVNHVMVSKDPEITTNWGTPDQYAAVGARVRRIIGDHAVLVAAENGTFAYYCDCEAVDNIFSDPGTMVPEIRSAERSNHGIVRWLVRLNFHLRDLHVKPLPYQYVLVYTKIKPGPGNIFWRLTSPSVGVGYDVLAPASL